MRKPILSLALCLMFASLSLAQPARLVPQNGGDGSDGTFFLSNGTMTFDTDVQAEYNFQTFEIGQNATLRIIGSRPCIIRCRTEVILNGTIDGSGEAGGQGGNNVAGGLGGLGGPGGGNGGDGACAGVSVTGIGMPGQGVSPGMPGFDTMGSFTTHIGGGGGGGNATPGTPGGPPNSGLANTNSGAGGPAVALVRAGSGGGGGGCDVDSLTNPAMNDGGAGGGGGGGYIGIYSSVGIQHNTNAVITVRGGDGGGSTGNGSGGGAGSGGTIDLVAPNILVDGSLQAGGGLGGGAAQGGCGCAPGGNSGDGSIEIRGNFAGSLSQTNPMPVFGPYCLMITTVGFVGEFEFEGNSGDAYIASFSGSLGAPLFIPGIATPIELNFLDPIYQLNFPVNQIPAVFGGLMGTIGVAGPLGVPRLNMALFAFSGQTLDLDVFAQGVTANGMGFTDVTPVAPIRIKL